MLLGAARAVERSLKQLRCRPAGVQLCAMVTAQAPPAAPERVHLHNDAVIIPENDQNNKRAKIVNTKQVIHARISSFLQILDQPNGSCRSKMAFGNPDLIMCKATLTVHFILGGS